MADLAELHLRISSDATDAGARSLSALSSAAKEAERAAAGVTTAFDKQERAAVGLERVIKRTEVEAKTLSRAFALIESDERQMAGTTSNLINRLGQAGAEFDRFGRVDLSPLRNELTQSQLMLEQLRAKASDSTGAIHETDQARLERLNASVTEAARTFGALESGVRASSAAIQDEARAIIAAFGATGRGISTSFESGVTLTGAEQLSKVDAEVARRRELIQTIEAQLQAAGRLGSTERASLVNASDLTNRYEAQARAQIHAAEAAEVQRVSFSGVGTSAANVGVQIQQATQQFERFGFVNLDELRANLERVELQIDEVTRSAYSTNQAVHATDQLKLDRLEAEVNSARSAFDALELRAIHAGDAIQREAAAIIRAFATTGQGISTPFEAGVELSSSERLAKIDTEVARRRELVASVESQLVSLGRLGDVERTEITRSNELIDRFESQSRARLRDAEAARVQAEAGLQRISSQFESGVSLTTPERLSGIDAEAARRRNVIAAIEAQLVAEGRLGAEQRAEIVRSRELVDRFQAETRARAGATDATQRQDQANQALGGTYNRLAGQVQALVVGFLAFASVRDAGSALASFDTAESKLSVVVEETTRGLEEQNAVLEDLRTNAREVGFATQNSAAVTETAYNQMIRSGFDARDSVIAVRAAMDFQEAEGVELGQSIDLVSRSLKQLDLDASQSERVLDLLSSVALKAQGSAIELGNGLVQLGPLAAQTGQEISGVVAALGVLSELKFRGGSGANALRELISSLIDPTEKAAAVFELLELNLADLDPRANSLTSILTRLKDANFDLEAATAAFSSRSALAISLLVQNADKTRQWADESERAAGLTHRLAEANSNNLKGSLEELHSSYQTIITTSQSGFTQGLRNIIDTTTDVIRILGDYDTANSRANDTAAAFADTLGFLTSQYGVVTIASLGFLGAVQGFGSSALVAEFAAKGLFATLLAHPFGALAAGIGLATGALILFRPEVISAREEMERLGDAVDLDRFDRFTRRIDELTASLNRARKNNDLRNQLEASRAMLSEINTLADQIQLRIETFGEGAQEPLPDLQNVLDKLGKNFGIEVQLRIERDVLDADLRDVGDRVRKNITDALKVGRGDLTPDARFGSLDLLQASAAPAARERLLRQFLPEGRFEIQAVTGDQAFKFFREIEEAIKPVRQQLLDAFDIGDSAEVDRLLGSINARLGITVEQFLAGQKQIDIGSVHALNALEQAASAAQKQIEGLEQQQRGTPLKPLARTGEESELGGVPGQDLANVPAGPLHDRLERLKEVDKAREELDKFSESLKAEVAQREASIGKLGAESDAAEQLARVNKLLTESQLNNTEAGKKRRAEIEATIIRLRELREEQDRIEAGEPRQPRPLAQRIIDPSASDFRKILTNVDQQIQEALAKNDGITAEQLFHSRERLALLANARETAEDFVKPFTTLDEIKVRVRESFKFDVPDGEDAGAFFDKQEDASRALATTLINVARQRGALIGTTTAETRAVDALVTSLREEADVSQDFDSAALAARNLVNQYKTFAGVRSALEGGVTLPLARQIELLEEQREKMQAQVPTIVRLLQLRGELNGTGEEEARTLESIIDLLFQQSFARLKDADASRLEADQQLRLNDALRARPKTDTEVVRQRIEENVTQTTQRRLDLVQDEVSSRRTTVEKFTSTLPDDTRARIRKEFDDTIAQFEREQKVQIAVDVLLNPIETDAFEALQTQLEQGIEPSFKRQREQLQDINAEQARQLPIIARALGLNEEQEEVLRNILAISVKQKEIEINAAERRNAGLRREAQRLGIEIPVEIDSADLQEKIDATNERIAQFQFNHPIISDAILDGFRGLNQAFGEFASGAKSAKDAVADFASNFLLRIQQMIVEQLLLNALVAAFGGGDSAIGGLLLGAFGRGNNAAGGGGGSGIPNTIDPFASANGNVFAFRDGASFDRFHIQDVEHFEKGGERNPYLNRIVSRATIAPLALFGEAGPEAIVPLKSNNGRLGVSAFGFNGQEEAAPLKRGAQGRLGIDLDALLASLDERDQPRSRLGPDPRPGARRFELGASFGDSISHVEMRQGDRQFALGDVFHHYDLHQDARRFELGTSFGGTPQGSRHEDLDHQRFALGDVFPRAGAGPQPFRRGDLFAQAGLGSQGRPQQFQLGNLFQRSAATQPLLQPFVVVPPTPAANNHSTTDNSKSTTQSFQFVQHYHFHGNSKPDAGFKRSARHHEQDLRDKTRSVLKGRNS